MWACGNLDGRNDSLLHKLGAFHRWRVAASIPTPIDEVMDGCAVRTHVKIDALCEYLWQLEQCSGNKSTHVAPVVPERIIGNRLLVAGLRSRVCLGRLPLTPGHYHTLLFRCREGVYWRVEGRSVSSVMGVRYRLYASDGQDLCSVDLVNVISRSAFSHYTGTLHASRCGTHSVFLQGKVTKYP